MQTKKRPAFRPERHQKNRLRSDPVSGQPFVPHKRQAFPAGGQRQEIPPEDAKYARRQKSLADGHIFGLEYDFTFFGHFSSMTAGDGLSAQSRSNG